MVAAVQVKLFVAGKVGYRWLERSKSWWLGRLGTLLVAGEVKLLMAGGVGVLVAWLERLGPAG